MLKMDIRALDISKLGLDEAYLNVTSLLDYESWLYALPNNCLKCPYALKTSLSPKRENILEISTKNAWKYRVLKKNVGNYVSDSDLSSVLCEVKENYWNMGHFGIYELVIDANDDAQVKCKTSTITDPVDIYLPLILMTVCLLAIGLLCKFLPYAWRNIQKRFNSNKILAMQTQTAQEKSKQAKPSFRVASLDTFRGISILLMIFANDGSGGYYILDHAIWDGLKLADIVFPWFVWIMGVCIPISINSQIKKEIPRMNILRGIVRRSCILFGLGVMLSTLSVGPSMETLRIFGILQRFGVLYLVVAGLCALLWPRNVKKEGNMRDILVLLPQWLIHLFLHCTHILIIFLLPVPDCATGYLGPGGISEDGKHYNCIGGATGYIDRMILSVDHTYQNPTANAVYKSGPFDPEGPYGCLSSLMTVMLGLQAGTTLLLFPEWKHRIKRWLAWGAVCLLITLPLALTHAIPINKNLWSTSYCLLTSGMAFIVLTICYVLIDKFRVWSGAPFLWPGMNATLMYVGHRLAYQLWPWHWKIGPMNTHLVVITEHLWGVAGWTLVAFLLYRRKFFLSI